MLRGSPTCSLRRLLLGAFAVLAALVAVAATAWACGPSFSSLSVTPSQGPAGTSATVSGGGFYDGPVEIRWDSASGPILATPTGPTFSAPITIPAAPAGVHYLLATSRYPDGTIAATSTRPFEVTRVASLALQPDRGPALSRTLVGGDAFPDGPVELHWDTVAGPLLAMATGPSFSAHVTIPASSPGGHRIVAVGAAGSGPAVEASKDFEVSAAPSSRTAQPPGLDTVGPAIVGATLARANRNPAVSRRGYVTLICGRFDEADVTGTCGATSVRGLSLRPGDEVSGRQPQTGSMPLRLRKRHFEARPGRAVRLRFRLTRTGLSLLKRDRRVRMRGAVVALDGLGNRSKTGFGFTLRAPQKARTASTPSPAASAAGW